MKGHIIEFFDLDGYSFGVGKITDYVSQNCFDFYMLNGEYSGTFCDDKIITKGNRNFSENLTYKVIENPRQLSKWLKRYV